MMLNWVKDQSRSFVKISIFKLMDYEEEVKQNIELDSIVPEGY